MRGLDINGIAFWITLLLLPLMFTASGTAAPFDLLNCRPFTHAVLPAPAPQQAPEATERFVAIGREVKSGPHSVLFVGDSLTQKWDPSVWERYFAPLGTLNAGVNGDRTEHLLWRLEHGTLDGQHPKVVIVLIGTNDIGRDRPAPIVAEGIREILNLLRERLPAAQILLLGVLPRGHSPSFRRRSQVRQVNDLIEQCADGKHIHFVDLAGALLDSSGVLSAGISPDGVHLSQQGYDLLGRRLALVLHGILGSQ